MDRKEMLYAFIKEEEYRPMKGKEIAALFCVPKKERAKFHALLDERKCQCGNVYGDIKRIWICAGRRPAG